MIRVDNKGIISSLRLPGLVTLVKLSSILNERTSNYKFNPLQIPESTAVSSCLSGKYIARTDIRTTPNA